MYTRKIYLYEDLCADDIRIVIFYIFALDYLRYPVQLPKGCFGRAYSLTENIKFLFVLNIDLLQNVDKTIGKFLK